MRKAYFYWIFSFIFIVSAIIFSCKSAPKTPPQPEPEPIPEEVEEEPPESVVIDTEVVPEITDIAVVPEVTESEARYAELGDILTIARAKRQEIMNGGFNEENQQPFDIADNALKRAAEAYDAGIDAINEDSFIDARFALDGFIAIIDSVWLSRADALRIRSTYSQQQALKLKADVAVKDRYNIAADLHNKGIAASRRKDYIAAIDFYESALPVFAEVIKTATEKREKAELALKSAGEKISESEKIVEDAVKIIENSPNGKGEIL
ncbi:MAG: hypothetical protein LBH18_05575 [Spirochaetaceae bacterium]|nr:hypothetical protein [Spirochaetaceae bacterium]